MQFLPENYEAPKSSSLYFKLQEGENKIRILSSPIIGWEDWENNKPIRFKMHQKPERSIDANKPMRHFWAMIIWDYAGQKIGVFEIAQASIRSRIEAISKDSDWGSPFFYDLKIIKVGQKVKTEYEVNPIAPKELEERIKTEFIKMPIDLEELFSGGDPFAATLTKRTKGFWEIMPPSVHSQPSADEYISQEQAEKIEYEISSWIAPHDGNWKENALLALKISSFSQLKKRLYDLTMRRIEEKKKIVLQEEIPF